ncbi:hypothetical protein A2U01_0021543 [Trifolium medium]|uniref:Uncharacterized protein n=1 Tax=Trifolium medium TaxID=97028 RepID=A0A392NL45_9FABA|nr:hypothetical protein [Trifolium medium]
MANRAPKTWWWFNNLFNEGDIACQGKKIGSDDTSIGGQMVAESGRDCGVWWCVVCVVNKKMRHVCVLKTYRKITWYYTIQ